MATTPLIGSNVKVEMQKTLGADKTITAITKANPAVVTSTAHVLSNGAVVTLKNIAGMVELDKWAGRVANVAANTFELEGVDSTNFSTFVSGTANEVTVWDTVGWATDLNLPSAAPTEIPATTLIDISTQFVYGLPEAPRGSIDGFFQPLDAAMINLRAATAANALRAFRITWQGANKAVFNANVAAGQGFTQGVNAAATTSIAMTIRSFANFYAV